MIKKFRCEKDTLSINREKKNNKFVKIIQNCPYEIYPKKRMLILPLSPTHFPRQMQLMYVGLTEHGIGQGPLTSGPCIGTKLPPVVSQQLHQPIQISLHSPPPQAPWETSSACWPTAPAAVRKSSPAISRTYFCWSRVTLLR